MTDLSMFKVAKSFKHLDPNQGLADGIATGFSSIRYKGKAWALQHSGKLYPFRRDDDGSPLTYIDIIILAKGAGISQVYFEGSWDEDSTAGPICASLKGDVPDPGVPVPQSKACGICSHFEWITKPNGQRGKECQSYKRLAVLLMPPMTKKMLGSPLLEPVFLKIPPGSFKTLKTYSDALQQQGIPFAAMVTRVSFAENRQFEMNFKAVQALTDAEAPLVLPLMDDQQTKTIIGAISQVREIAAPAPAKERIDTGLMEAFGGGNGNGNGAAESTAEPVKRSRGRPKAVPAQTIEHEPEPPKAPVRETPVRAAPAKMATEPPAGETDAETSWEESDTDLDETVAKLMGDKMNKMLK